MDWSELPQHILYRISRQLGDIANMVRFRAVCTAFLSSAPLSDPPPLLPWFLSSSIRPISNDLHFCSFLTRKIHKISIPEGQHKRCLGLSHGFLVLYDAGHAPTLLNPLNRTQISLPPLNSSWFEPVYIGHLNGLNAGSNGRWLVIFIGDIQTRKQSDQNTCAGSSCTLAFWKYGDSAWTTVEIPTAKASTCWRGKFFVSGVNGETTTVDLTTGTKLDACIPPPSRDTCFSHLISAYDELLGIVDRPNEGHLGDVRKFDFEVYKLHCEKEHARWVKTSDIGNFMLFLDSNRGFSLKASDFDGLKGNCIYSGQSDSNGKHMLCKYDIDDCGITMLEYPPSFHGFWFVPGFGENFSCEKSD